MLKIQNAIPFIGMLFWCPKACPQRYHLVRASLPWDEALRYCSVKHSGLATVDHMQDQEALTGSLDGDAWIGLRRGGGNRWMWSDGYGKAELTRWDDGKPNEGGDERCAEMSQYGKWTDLSCHDKRKFVCYQGEADGGKSFHFYSGDELTWASSLERCRDAHTDLAHISTTDQNSEVGSLIGSWTGIFGFPKKAWLGLFRDRWVWSGGAATSFRFWLTDSESYGDCGMAAAGHNGRWIPEDCGRNAMVVCEGALKVKKMVVRMKMSSGVDLSNKTVSGALLMKLHSNLRLHNLTDFTLSWRRDQHGAAFHRLDQPGVPKT